MIIGAIVKSSAKKIWNHAIVKSIGEGTDHTDTSIYGKSYSTLIMVDLKPIQKLVNLTFKEESNLVELNDWSWMKLWYMLWSYDICYDVMNMF